jgi:hypothetical protein
MELAVNRCELISTYLLPLGFLPKTGPARLELEHDIPLDRTETGEVRAWALGESVARHGVASVARADQLRADHESVADFGWCRALVA